MSTDSITLDPAVMQGRPCVAGTRVTVEYILELLEDGHTMDTIVAEHRTLTKRGVEAAIAYARAAVMERHEGTAAK